MRILATNDDGILAPGLEAMRRALVGFGEVTVVAPTTAQSAVGHAITLADPIRCHRMDLSGGGVGYAVEGRPADCVKLAVLELLPERPDLVVSGINLGANVGINILYSGTVAAAVEGAFYGIPSVAVSLEDADVVDFDGAARIARHLIEQFLAQPATSRPRLLNINVPDLAGRQPKGVRVVSQSMKGFAEGWDRRLDPRGRTYYWMVGGQDFEDSGVTSDVSALADGYVTVTPLRFDLTDTASMGAVDGWGLGL